jgi:hypothetical protein
MKKVKLGKFAKKAIFTLAIVFSLGFIVAGNTFAATPLCDNVHEGKPSGKYKTDCGPVGDKGQHISATNMSWCAQAANYATNKDACEEGRDVNTIVRTIINVIVYIVGLLAVIMIIYGGILYTTSAGDPGKVKKAKDTILYGIVGLVIAVLAFAIVNFILGAVLSNQSA